MVGEVAKKNLYDATTNGESQRFDELLLGDRYILDEVSFACSRNLLHIAAMHGSEAIVQKVLRINSRLARNLDSQKSSPLHIAAAQGNVPIVHRLLETAPEMCWLRDCHGMNPVHIAAMNGNEHILEVLINRDPFPAAEKLDRGQTVLHLCVKHRKFEALRYLVENLRELVNVEDDDGEMVLHLAVRFKQIEAVECLLENYRTYELPKNSKGKTVQQISRENSPDETSLAIDEILSNRLSYSGKPVGFLAKMSDITMVVVILIATMAFQAAVNPPGGVWQADSSPQHKAGEAVMAFTRPKIFKNFKQANTAAFVSSIITIILLTTGLPSENILFTMTGLCTTWVSLASIAICYKASLIVITPNLESQSIAQVINIVVFIFLGIYLLFCASSLVTFWPYWMARVWRRDQEANRRVFRSRFTL